MPDRFNPELNQPAGLIILERLGARDWVFNYPRLTLEVHEALGEAIDLMDYNPGAAKPHFRRLIRDYPEYLDARHHLALCWYREGKLDKAAQLWKEAFNFALKLLPADFSLSTARLEYGCLENRPFLRLYHSYGLTLMEQHRTKAAVEVFENLLSLNPNDNQGARALATRCYFELRQPGHVLAVCDKYPDDITEDLAFGRVLALFQLGEITQAADAFRKAFAFLPRVGQELVKRAHRRPADYHESYVKFGSLGQAYGYWKQFGQYWRETPGAIDFIRTRLAEIKKNGPEQDAPN